MFTPQVIVLTVLVFFVLVGIHEWGHYYFARRAGILVREFALGFGPKLFSYKKGETRYTIRLLPLGGFVRMAGEDPEVIQINTGQTIAIKLQDNQVSHLYLDKLDQRTNVVQGIVEHIDLERELSIRLELDGDNQTFPIDPKAMIVARGTETQIAPWDRQFGSKTVAQRSLAIFAGPMMNFVLAFILFVTFTWVSGVPESVKLRNINPGQPAAEAQLHIGDIVRNVNGETIGTDTQKLITMIGSSGNKEMEWEVLRNNKTESIKVTPMEKDGKGIVGIEIEMQTRDAKVTEVFSGAWNNMIDFSEQIFIGLKKLVTLQVKMDDLGGPVRIVEVTGQAASSGVPTLILWAALLSLYLGIFNLLPFPALDGSRLLFLGIEALRGKPIDPHRENMVHFIGFAMLMLLMLAVTYNDILRLFNG